MMVACLVAMLGFGNSGHARPALAVEEAAPPAPADGIFDEARIFQRVPRLREALGQRLREFRERTGFEVYVVLLDGLVGRDLQQEAKRLRNSWLGGEPGVVMAMDADTSACVLAWSEPSIHAGDRKLPVVGPGEVSPQERILIWRELGALERPEIRSHEDAAKLVDALLRSLDKVVTPAEQEPPSRFGHLLLLALGLGSALLLVGMLVAAAVRRADHRASDRLFFPVVPVGERLKAPRGGGKVSSRNFGASS